jgi:hypothetical protein
MISALTSKLIAIKSLRISGWAPTFMTEGIYSLNGIFNSVRDILHLKMLGVDAILSLQTYYDLEKRGKNRKHEEYLNEMSNLENIVRINFGIVDRSSEDFEQKGLEVKYRI